MMLVGPTACGKTTFVKRLIQYAPYITNIPPKNIVYCYEEYQPLYDSMKDVTFIHGLPDDIIERFDGSEPSWLILDDMMNRCGKSEVVSTLFTRGSHHRNLSIIFITQNLYFRGPHARDISLNSHYIVIFKNPRDRQNVEYMGRQMFGPKAGRRVGLAYEKATHDPYSYIFLDFRAETPPEYRVLSHCFGEAGPFLFKYDI